MPAKFPRTAEGRRRAIGDYLDSLPADRAYLSIGRTHFPDNSRYVPSFDEPGHPRPPRPHELDARILMLDMIRPPHEDDPSDNGKHIVRVNAVEGACVSRLGMTSQANLSMRRRSSSRATRSTIGRSCRLSARSTLASLTSVERRVDELTASTRRDRTSSSTGRPALAPSPLPSPRASGASWRTCIGPRQRLGANRSPRCATG